MGLPTEPARPQPEEDDTSVKRLRSDARRSLDALLQAAKEVFGEAGVDAPVRQIAVRAGLGVGTVYRHFPRRSDLVAAVFRREMDACADAAATCAEAYPPFDALAQWLQRFADFFVAKRGLAVALHSGDAAFKALPVHFDRRLRPALRSLLATAIAAGEVRSDVADDELLHAVARLCSASAGEGSGSAQRMVALLTDGLRYRGASVVQPPGRPDADTARPTPSPSAGAR